MSLLDALLGKVYDDASSARRSRAERRRDARDEVVAQLRAYSIEVEHLRASLIQALDALLPAVGVGGGYVGTLNALPVLQVVDRYDGQRVREATAITQSTLTPEAVAVLLLPVTAPWGMSALATDELTKAVKDASVDFQSAWPSLRVLLDDTLEADAVLYLREYRHHLRRLLGRAVHAMESYTGAGPGPTLHEVRVDILNALAVANLWGEQILGVRTNTRGG